MDALPIVFWFVCLSCVSALVVTLTRSRIAISGWVVVLAAILFVSLLGWFTDQGSLVYAAGAMWLGLVMLPAFLGQLYQRRFLQQRYIAARRLARIVGFLHPADGWREQVRLVRAAELAQKGDMDAASHALETCAKLKSISGLIATVTLFRMTQRWEELLRWEKEREEQFFQLPQLLSVQLRTRGETGDLSGLIELYDANRHRIAKLVPASNRDLCRLMLFVFCGKRELAELLFAGGLKLLPRAIQSFWLATADLAAGKTDVAKSQFEALLAQADPVIRAAVQRRLAQPLASPRGFEPRSDEVMAQAAKDQVHDESFGARPGLFSRGARATRILLLANVAMFLVELASGGSTDFGVLFRLGALVPEALRMGQWWRIVTANFLHFGVLHLAMNMFALCLLGPFVEFALGAARFTFVYVFAGIASMSAVLLFSLAIESHQMTVGASGAIMGLIGATGGLMLVGWLKEKAAPARRRLTTVAIVIATQIVFDALMPQVSMTAHVTGAIMGFGLCLLLRNRLGACGNAQ